MVAIVGGLLGMARLELLDRRVGLDAQSSAFLSLPSLVGLKSLTLNSALYGLLDVTAISFALERLGIERSIPVAASVLLASSETLKHLRLEVATCPPSRSPPRSPTSTPFPPPLAPVSS